MKEIELGIEISEDVVKTKMPDKIERYDLVPQKEEKKYDMPRKFTGYRPGMGKYWLGGGK